MVFNRQIRLKSRPVSMPRRDDFEIADAPPQTKDGEVLDMTTMTSKEHSEAPLIKILVAWHPRVHSGLLHNRVLHHRISERRVVNCRVLHTSVNRSPISQWPAQSECGSSKAIEATLGFGTLGEMRGKNLDRNDAIEPRVARPVHLTHAACAQRRLYFVGTKFGARGECHACG
jgi:hypothetical protein